MSNSKKRFQKLLCASLALSNIGSMPVHAANSKSYSDSLKPFWIGLGSSVLGSAIIGGIVLGVERYTGKESLKIPSKPTDEPHSPVQPSSKPIHKPRALVMSPAGFWSSDGLEPFYFDNNMKNYYRCDDGLKISKKIVKNEIDEAIGRNPYTFDNNELSELSRQFRELYEKCGKPMQQEELVGFDYPTWNLSPPEYIFSNTARAASRGGWAGLMTNACSTDVRVKRRFAECVKFAYSKINDDNWSEHIGNFIQAFVEHGGHCETRFEGMVINGKLALDEGLLCDKDDTRDFIFNLFSDIKCNLTRCVADHAAQLHAYHSDGSVNRESVGTVDALYFASCFDLGILSDSRYAFAADPRGIINGLLNRHNFCEVSDGYIKKDAGGALTKAVEDKAKKLKISFNDYCRCCGLRNNDKHNIRESARNYYDGDCTAEEELFKSWVNGADVELSLYDAHHFVIDMAPFELNGVAKFYGSNMYGTLFLIECFAQGYLG